MLKKNHRARASRTQQVGFSLVELMISVTIGLIITVAALSAYIGSSNASKVTDAQARMNEDAQAALNVLTQQIRLAGGNPVQAGRADAYRQNPVYLNTYVGGSVTAYTTTLPTFVPATYTMSSFAIRGCDGTFGNITAATTIGGLTCTGGTTTLPDSIAVSYEADQFNTVRSGTAGTDCVGSALPSVAATFASGTPTTATFYVADNRFYVANSAGIPSLFCKGVASQTQPLVENIEDLQITYGTINATTSSSTATVAGYLSAFNVVNETSMAALTDDATRWGRVLTARICVVVRSDSPVAPNTAASAFFNCEGTLDTSKTDLRLRKSYSTTVVLRNRRS